MPAPKDDPAYRRVGTLLALKRELINRGQATAADVDRVARRYVAECGCRVVTLDKMDGKGPVAWIVTDLPAVPRAVVPGRRKRTA